VVLGGGLIDGGNRRFLDAIREGLARSAPLAVAQVVPARPILGAALLALESLGATPEALVRLRRDLTASHPRPTPERRP
jgi:hypothetical protein